MSNGRSLPHGGRAAKIIQEALGIESDDVANYVLNLINRRRRERHAESVLGGHLSLGFRSAKTCSLCGPRSSRDRAVRCSYSCTREPRSCLRRRTEGAYGNYRVPEPGKGDGFIRQSCLSGSVEGPRRWCCARCSYR